MKIENQVCSLEQAKELDKLGVKAESYFVWAVAVDVGGGRDKIVLIPRAKIENWHYDIYPAYTDDELGVMLTEVDECEAHAKAALLITILKEGLVKPGDCKL